MYEKNFKEKNLVPQDLPGVPRVPILGPNRGIFSKLDGPGPLGSGGHSHTSFSNGRFRALETSFHIDVQTIKNVSIYTFLLFLLRGYAKKNETRIPLNISESMHARVKR